MSAFNTPQSENDNIEKLSNKDMCFAPFNKYFSIRNSYVVDEVNYVKQMVPPTEEWVAMEKVHGCNFSATTNGAETKWASRSGYLSPSELQKFNNAPKVVSKYGSTIESTLLHHLQKERFSDKNITHIRVFGELYGGKYEGHVVEHRAIQKEISYCPDIEFIVFDIECIHPPEVSSSSSGGESTEEGDVTDESQISPTSFFLTPMQVIEACEMCNLPVLNVLHSGSLDDLLALDTVFQTTIPSTLFGLPHTSSNNESEGYVLRPKNQVLFKPNGTRIMFKHKNPKFTERTSSKATAVPKTKNAAGDVTTIMGMLSQEGTIVFEQMKQYINENRINAVLSKLDESVKMNRKRVLFLISSDAVEDIELELKAELATVSSKDRKQLNRLLNHFTEDYCNFHSIDFLA